jgi:hypothetical protein
MVVDHFSSNSFVCVHACVVDDTWSLSKRTFTYSPLMRLFLIVVLLVTHAFSFFNHDLALLAFFPYSTFYEPPCTFLFSVSSYVMEI